MTLFLNTLSCQSSTHKFLSLVLKNEWMGEKKCQDRFNDSDANSVADPDVRYVFGPLDPDPDPLVRGTATAPDPSIIKQK
jgi:hypothetical protein